MTDSIISDCLFCFSNRTKKHGVLKKGGQRYKCNECFHTYTLGGIRGTYDDAFKKRVVENYCHKNQKVVEILNHYGISSRTLIKRSKEHQTNCGMCLHT